MDEEKAYWLVYCQSRGMSLEDFERRWPVVSVTYRLTLQDPTAPLEKILGQYLKMTSASGLCEASRRRAFGRIWAKILARHNGEIRPDVIDWQPNSKGCIDVPDAAALTSSGTPLIRS